MKTFNIIVIGAGHAGIEAALASSRMGLDTALITLRKDTIGLMSCNPAIGGVGKGQLVKEIDALGGQMGIAADACGIQFRILNASKGPAVQSSRAQIDMQMYAAYMQRIVAAQEKLFVVESEVKKLLVEGGMIKGVEISGNQIINAQAVIICAGTFLNGLIHKGLKHTNGGRIDEQASIDLPAHLQELGLTLLQFKTGTCPRLSKQTIDFSKLIVQNGDENPHPFSFSTKALTQKQVPCYITYTNKNTHAIINRNLDKSPLYAGIIQATGVRYCPSIEDKIVKFPERLRHQIFLEPQGYEVDEIYPNGLSTSLPEEVQVEMVRSVEGLEKAEIIRFGYGIEHAVVEPTQLYPTLETKLIKNFYCAGQINGTTGYEEAAAQGLIAGINAGLRVQGRDPIILDRSSSYIGVLIDDLTTKGTLEPYRMFTSRVEYRLVIREDNADVRLRKTGYEAGLISKEVYRKAEEKQKATTEGIQALKATRIKPDTSINALLTRLKTPLLKKSATLEELLKRPEVTLKDLAGIEGVSINIPESASLQVEIEVKYSGFIERQLVEVEKFKHLEKIKLPSDIDYSVIPALSREIKEKLIRFKPLTLGQASRISGVTPAAISILMVYLKKFAHSKN